MIERILNLIQQKGITAKKLTADLEISNSSVTDWKKGSKPSCEVLIKLAQYFNVSTDYILLGKDSSLNLSEADQEWLDLIHQLPTEKMYEFKGELKGYLRYMEESAVVKPSNKTGTDNPK